VRLVLQHLSGMYEAAIADGFVNPNPRRGAKRPKVDKAPVVPLTAEQVEALDAAAPPWFSVAITLGAWCGLRQAEAAGLTVDRVDFLRRQLTVNRQLSMHWRGPLTFGPLKTRRSYRTVPLADDAVARLAVHVEQFGTGEEGLLLHEDGQPVPAARFVKVWQQTRRRAELPSVRFHDTRH
jgi:integrase